MEDFSAAHLQEMIKKIGDTQIAGLRQAQAKTARGQKVTEILQNRGQMSNRRPNAMNSHPQTPSSQNQNGNNLDSVIRQAMGELVKRHIQENRLNELQGILLEHKSFIDDILRMINQK